MFSGWFSVSAVWKKVKASSDSKNNQLPVVEIMGLINCWLID